ncbi:T-cell surface glycoprotein CD1d1 [Cricetulus griseus]|uniref:T-cell surface glycoprotein CD1d1 n=1 Tax=Cricetulus griseus TaxID=10029 RepID=G3HKH6_CRIGR|nr:T-cell surface glycoprotein CD1d1 [Cricetulus griseus]
MRYLTCLLLWVLQLVWGQWEDQLKNYPLRCLQISSFPNSSSFRTDGLAWLGDVQTHSWRNASTVSFLKPWSHGKLSDQQWQTLEHILQVYRTSFTRDIQELVKMLPIIHCE